MEKLYNLKDVFHNRILRIPDYQRGYAWSGQQLKDFWDDIINLTANRKHYTGMISLKKLNHESTKGWEDESWALNNYEAYHVVDGQQRLTTFSILLVCILNRLRTLQKNKNKTDEEITFNTRKLSDIVSEFICERNAELPDQKIYKFGYEKDNPSFRYLKAKIFGDELNEEIATSFYTQNLKRAKNFFEKKINELSEDETELENKLKEIYNKATNDLLFNLQDLADEFDVFVAFETMNNRGLSLSNLEKLKNRLMYLANLYDERELNNSQYLITRRKINDSWMEVYKQLGRNEKHPLEDDEYLRNHWFLYFKYSRSETSYDKFLLTEYFIQKNVLSKGSNHVKPIDILNYVNDLSNTARYWYYSYNPYDWTGSDSITEEEKKWIDKLNRLEMAYFRPLIVVSLMRKDITPDERISLFKGIERFVFILFRSLTNTSQYQQSFYLKKARDLKDGNIKIGEIITNLNDDVNNNSNEMNSFYERIGKLFDSKDGFYSWEGLKYFLYEYESSLVEKNGNIKIHADDFFKKGEKDLYSVEHIFPQTSGKVWYWANNFRFFNQQEKHSLCNSLGNLLPLSRAINASLQNYEFPIKKEGSPDSDRRGYKQGSHSEIEILAYPDWTYETIKQRGLDLLKFYENRWKVNLGDDKRKTKLLNLEFLDSKSYDVPEIQKFKDDVNFIAKTSYKYIKNAFWINLTNRAPSILTMDDIGFSKPSNGHQLWFIKDFAGRASFLLKLDNDKRKIYLKLNISSKEGYAPLINAANEIEQKTGIKFNWDDPKNGNQLTVATFDFDVTDESSWNKIEEEVLGKANQLFPIFESILCEKYSNTITRKKKPKLSESEFLSDKSDSEKLVKLYKMLRQQLDSIYTDASIYFTSDYCAYQVDKLMFVGIHFLKDAIQIKTKYGNLDVEGGEKVPDSHNWNLNYIYKINSEEKIPVALDVIKASFDEIVSSSKKS